MVAVTKPHPGTLQYCFVGKNFVVRLSTTKTTKILPPPRIPAIRYAHKQYMLNIVPLVPPGACDVSVVVATGEGWEVV